MYNWGDICAEGVHFCTAAVTSWKWRDTGHSKGLREGVEGRAPSDLPRGDVSQHKAQFVQQVPHLLSQRTN